MSDVAKAFLVLSVAYVLGLLTMWLILNVRVSLQ